MRSPPFVPIDIRVNWNEISTIEQKIIGALKSVQVRNISEANIVLSKKNGEIHVKLSCKPFDFPDTDRSKGVQCSVTPLLGEHVVECRGVEFRQEKTHKRRRVVRISTGVQTVAIKT